MTTVVFINPFIHGGVSGGGGGGGGGDPHFASVVSLLHFDGADASTTFTDVTGKTWTANGNAQIDTSQSVFGGASGLFDGTGDFIDTPDHANFSLGTNDFTIEFRVRFAATDVFYRVCGQFLNSNSNRSFAFQRQADNKIIAACASGAGLIGACTTTGTFSADTWYALAYVRSGSDFALFVDGAVDGTASSASAVNDVSQKLAIGREGEFNGDYLNGWIDEFRLTNGVARYVSSYTPATEPFPDS